MKTITTTAQIGPERRLEVTLPDDVPLGAADIVVVVSPREAVADRAREALRKIGGTLETDEVEAFLSAHRNCERIHPDDWR